MARGTGSNDAVALADTAQAMARVLHAERQAEVQLAEARREAQAMVEAARQQALARVNRTLERIARWQRGHALAMASRLADVQVKADAARRALPTAGAPEIAVAIEQVAARLTGAGGGRA